MHSPKSKAATAVRKRILSAFLGTVACLAFCACDGLEIESRESELGLGTAPDSTSCTQDSIFCDDFEPTTMPSESPSEFTIAAAELTETGDQINFNVPEAKSWTVSVVVDLGDPMANRTRGYVDVSKRAQDIRIVSEEDVVPIRRSTRLVALDRNDRDSTVVLSAGRRELDTVTLIEHIKISVDEAGNATLGAGDLTLIDNATNTAIAMHRFEPGLVAPPSNCTERALVRFGPLPWNMPPLNFPEIESCSSSRCTTITEGWIRGHHNVWRVTQMLAFLATQGSAQRSYYWKRPATDALGEGVDDDGSDTSFAYTFGGYTNERYYAVREGFYLLMDIFLKSKTLASKIHLKCGSCGGYGKHSTIGWPNVCSGAFNDSAGLYDDNQDAVTHTVMHELMHWLFIEIDAGPRALRDSVTHGHGRWCTSGVTTTYVDSISEVRHFATYKASDNGTCWHRSKGVQIIEAYTNMAMRIGEGVKDGELVYWPEFAEPTPQPPVCVGTEGCLCSELPPFGEIPDGNHSIDQYCDNNDGEATCVRTAVNAGAIVGICTKCEPVRGPGCECHAQLPCDEGSCWGDDTHGGGVGHCYDDDPPSWACLADCKRLFNENDAECINNHLGGARCVDSSCPQYISEDCYAQNMVCREGNCIVECANVQDCTDRGYPAAFECVGNRCEFPF